MRATALFTLLLAAAVLAGSQVRYSNAEIAAKLFALREMAEVGGPAATEMVSHGTKVRVEFSVGQPTPGHFESRVTYHLQNNDGSWKDVAVDYECRELNMHKLCYGRSCPVAQYRPASVPQSIADCLETARQAADVLKYMLLNNAELTRNAAALKACVKDKTAHEKAVAQVCFNNAVADIDKAVAELREDGYALATQADGSLVWQRVLQTTK